MRLTLPEQNGIKDSILEFDPNAQIFLFGSRVDDSKSGGDIDILVLSETLSSRDQEKLRTRICSRIGWQKIDLVIAKDDTSPFVRLALSSGVRL